MVISLKYAIIFEGTTGTAKDHVVVDYGKKLHEAKWNMKEIMTILIKDLLLKQNPSSVEWLSGIQLK
jgi:hypothetical protein